MAHTRASIIICLIALLENIGVLAAFVGGWSLAEQECPAGAVSCAGGICCPVNTFCHAEGIAWACCPDRSDCGPIIKSFPVCADPSLVLYKGHLGNYFCCPSNQQGIYPANHAVGLCVASDMSVGVTQSAIKATPNSAAPTSSESAPPSISTSSAPASSSAVITTATESSAPQSTAPSTITQSTTPSTTTQSTTPSTTVSTSASATKSSGSAGPKSWFAGASVITAIGAIFSVFMVLL